MADPLKYLFLCIILLAGVQATAAPVLDVATLPENQGLKLAPYFRYIQPDAQQSSPEQALSVKPWLSNKAQKPDNFAGETWIALTLSNSSDTAKQLALVQANPQLNEFTLWQKRQQQQQFTKLYTLGLKYPFSQRPIEHRLFVMPITIEPGELLQLMISSNVAGYDLVNKTTLWQQDTFLQKDNLNAFWQAFYFGAVFVMVCYNLVVHLLTRETSYLWYTAFVGSSLGMFFVLSNWPFQYLWPNTPAITNPLAYFFMAVMLAFAGFFAIRFLNLKQRYPNISKAIYFFSIAVLVEYFIYFITPFDEAYTMIRAIMATSVPLYFLNLTAGILVWKKFNVVEAGIYVIAWSLLIVITIAALIHETWWPFIPVPVISAVQAAHLFEVVLLSMALATRINRLKRQEHMAEAKAATQTQFLARMSHEIRTPMNGIVAIADLLKHQPDPKKHQHYIEIINNSAKALSLIVNDVLDYSKISAGKLQLKTKPCDIRQLVKETTLLFELPCEQKSLHLSYHVSDDVPESVVVDSDRLRQILINLLSNAVKYTHQGFVKLTLKIEKQQLLFSVTDSGTGISKTDYEKVFSAFEQGNNNNLGRESSTGLGLAICKELVALMDGEINVESSTKGSNFWFAIELITNKSPKPETLETVDASASVKPITLNKILVAEDNLISQKVISHLLKHLELDFHLVENGQQALDYFKQHVATVDIILMDCEMPVMNGFTASKEIRAFEQSQQISKTPIIALTAHTLHEELQHCLQSGMDELLVKPITLSVLTQTLQKAAATVVTK